MGLGRFAGGVELEVLGWWGERRGILGLSGEAPGLELEELELVPGEH